MVHKKPILVIFAVNPGFQPHFFLAGNRGRWAEIGGVIIWGGFTSSGVSKTLLGLKIEIGVSGCGGSGINVGGDGPEIFGSSMKKSKEQFCTTRMRD